MFKPLNIDFEVIFVSKFRGYQDKSNLSQILFVTFDQIQILFIGKKT